MPNILASKECGVTPLFDTDSNSYQMLINGATQQMNPGFSDITSTGNWILSGTLSFNSSTPSGSFDISNCDKFMVYISFISCSGANYLHFGTDTGANYSRQRITATGTSVTAAVSSENGFVMSGSTTPIFETMIFDKSTKCGSAKYIYNTSFNEYGFKYSGTDSMNTISFTTNTTTVTGTIKVYKWQEFKPVDLATYEVVRSYIRTGNGAVSENIPWDSNIDSNLYVVCKGKVSTASSAFVILINGDATASNYVYAMLNQDGSTVSASSSTNAGFSLASSSSTVYMHTISHINLSPGVYPTLISQRTTYNSANTDSMCFLYNSYYKGTSVTSLTFQIDAAFVGEVTIYKLAKSHLISSSPNLITTWIKSIDNDTIQIQPGEIEISGAICNISIPTSITLSGNLMTGLTETTSTYYYLYAIRGSGRDLTYVFDTVAPTMDRYGNIVSSFQDCDFSKGWFHPTYGINYRFIGQVYNNASSNILAFDKMKPGYWESGWTSLPTTESWVSLSHAFGKPPTGKDIKLIGSSTTSSSGARTITSIYYTYTTVNNGFGVFLDCNPNAISTSNLLYVWFGGAGIFLSTSWQTTGYYKLIISE